MSDKTDAANAAPDSQAALTPREAFERDRRNARRRHLTHYGDQAGSWAIVIALAALSVPLGLAYRLHYLAPCQFASDQFATCAVHYVGMVLPSLVLLLMLLWNLVYYHNKHNDWKVAIGNAQQLISAHNVTNGFTDLFNLYMRTKRRSYLLAGWGMLAIVYVVVGIVLNLKEDAPTLFWISLVFEAGFGLALLVFGYYMGSKYLPGEVIVRHTLALSIFAISNVTNAEEAKRQAEKDAEQFIRDNPWWFYPG
jgi:hypothetical protein